MAQPLLIIFGSLRKPTEVTMSNWVSARDRRQRLQKALQLLVASGVIRPATLELTYFGGGRIDAAFSTGSNVSSFL